MLPTCLVIERNICVLEGNEDCMTGVKLSEVVLINIKKNCIEIKENAISCKMQSLIKKRILQIGQAHARIESINNCGEYIVKPGRTVVIKGFKPYLTRLKDKAFFWSQYSQSGNDRDNTVTVQSILSR